MSLSKKVFQPKMMANYYQKLALVFWKSDQVQCSLWLLDLSYSERCRCSVSVPRGCRVQTLPTDERDEEEHLQRRVSQDGQQSAGGGAVRSAAESGKRIYCQVLEIIPLLQSLHSLQHPEFDRFIETDRSPAEKMARLAVLLSLNQPPTRYCHVVGQVSVCNIVQPHSRQSLLRDCQRFNVVSAASPQLQDLYNWLEVSWTAGLLPPGI